MALARASIVFAGLLAAWQLLVWLTGVEPYILPGPLRVLAALVAQSHVLAGHAAVTIAEMLAGLAAGTLLGSTSALAMAYFRPARQWILPVLVISQAVPVFALAPVLVLWFGYGMAPKVAMATLIIYFPVTAAFYDGLRRTEPGWLDLSRTMNASAWAMLRHIRLPAALPACASGLRIAAAVAPIGAIVGEWVGASSGLGYYMLHANARLQADAMFAALLVLAFAALALYFTLDWSLRRALPWQSDTDPFGSTRP